MPPSTHALLLLATAAAAPFSVYAQAPSEPPFVAQTFSYGWPGVVNDTLTRCRVLNISITPADPNHLPLGPFDLTIYSQYQEPFVINAGTTFDYLWTVDLNLGGPYLMTMTDAYGGTGGSQPAFNVVADPLGSTCGSSGMVSSTLGLSIQPTAPSQCGNVTVAVTGGTAPFTMVLVPESGLPKTVEYSTGNFNYTLDIKAGTNAYIAVNDALGHGAISSYFTAAQSDDASCLGVAATLSEGSPALSTIYPGFPTGAASSSSKKSDTGAIVGGVVAGLGAAIIILLAIFWLLRRRRRRNAAGTAPLERKPSIDGSGRGATNLQHHPTITPFLMFGRSRHGQSNAAPAGNDGAIAQASSGPTAQAGQGPSDHATPPASAVAAATPPASGGLHPGMAGWPSSSSSGSERPLSGGPQPVMMYPAYGAYPPMMATGPDGQPVMIGYSHPQAFPATSWQPQPQAYQRHSMSGEGMSVSGAGTSSDGGRPGQIRMSSGEKASYQPRISNPTPPGQSSSTPQPQHHDGPPAYEPRQSDASITQ